MCRAALVCWCCMSAIWLLRVSPEITWPLNWTVTSPLVVICGTWVARLNAWSTKRYITSTRISPASRNIPP